MDTSLNTPAELSNCLFEPKGVTLTYTLDDGTTAIHRYLWKPDERRSPLVIDIQQMGDTFLPTHFMRRENYIDEADVYAALGARVSVTLSEKMGHLVASDPERILKLPVILYAQMAMFHKKILDVIARYDGISFSLLDSAVGKYVETAVVQVAVMDLWLKGKVRIIRCDDKDDRLLGLSTDLQTEAERRCSDAKATSPSWDR